MNTPILDIATPDAEAAPRSYRWTRAAYEQLGDAGVFGPEERVQLVDGEIIDMSPQYSPHATALSLTQYALDDAFGEGFYVRVQLPLNLNDHSQPEPDVAVMQGSPRDYRKAHPTTASLVVEVSDSTLRFDQTRKLVVYAAAGIPEYWIVNLIENTIEVYRDPRGATYGAKQTYGTGQSITPLAAPNATVAVSDLLP